MVIKVNTGSGEVFTISKAGDGKVNWVKDNEQDDVVEQDEVANQDEVDETQNDVVDENVNEPEDNEPDETDEDSETDEVDEPEEDGENETDETEDKKEPVKKDGFQKRVDKLNKRNEESVKKINELQDELERLNNFVEKLYDEVDELKEPDFNEYDDDEKYRQDYTTYQHKKVAKETLREERAKEAQKAMQEVYNKKFLTAIEDGSTRYEKEEFDKAMKNEKIFEDIVMANTIFNSDLAGDIIFYLHTNKEEFNKIKNQKNSKEREKMLHKLEAKIEFQLDNKEVTSNKKNVANISKAPPPVSTIKNKVGENGVSVSRKISGFSDYKKLRLSGKIK